MPIGVLEPITADIRVLAKLCIACTGKECRLDG